MKNIWNVIGLRTKGFVENNDTLIDNTCQYYQRIFKSKILSKIINKTKNMSLNISYFL